MEFIDLKTQYQQIQETINARIQAVLNHGQYIMGPEVQELEEKLADCTGAKHCIAVSSGTDALLIAMMALDVAPGDEIITTPFTFIATAETIALLGATPVFVDIEPRTYNIDPIHVEAAITEKTKAILPVSLYGQCADFDAINAIAKVHGIPVIEDAAQSFGATYKGRRSCALSTVGCTSFFPSKPLGGYGDGGACFTDDDGLAKAIRELRNHGQSRRYHHTRVGLNGRLDTLQAAILLAKLEHYPEEITLREKIGQRYTTIVQSQCTEFDKLNLTTPYIEPRNTSVYAQYTLQIDHRDAVADALKNHGIPTAVHYPVPLHKQPVFADLKHHNQRLPIAEKLATRVISLPMGPRLTEDQQRNVINSLFQAMSLNP